MSPHLILSYLISYYLAARGKTKKNAADNALIHYTCPPVLAGRRPPVWRTWVVRHRRGAAEQVSSVCRSRRHLRLRLPCLTSPPAGHLLGLTRCRQRPSAPSRRPAHRVEREVVETIIKSAPLRDGPREATSFHVAAQTIPEGRGHAVLGLSPLPNGGTVDVAQSSRGH